LRQEVVSFGITEAASEVIGDFHDLGFVLDAPRGLRPDRAPSLVNRLPDGDMLCREAPDAVATPLLESLQ
jgi:hypothetical protein